jgi:hypothetical protein
LSGYFSLIDLKVSTSKFSISNTKAEYSRVTLNSTFLFLNSSAISFIPENPKPELVQAVSGKITHDFIGVHNSVI